MKTTNNPNADTAGLVSQAGARQSPISAGQDQFDGSVWLACVVA